MKFENLAFKTITVNHIDKFVNVYIHSDSGFVPSDGLLTLASNLLSIGLKRDLKDQIFDKDIIEIFKDDEGTSKHPIAILIVEWNSNLLCWEMYRDVSDYRLFGDPLRNQYDMWSTHPKAINNKFIPVGYEIRNILLP